MEASESSKLLERNLMSNGGGQLVPPSAQPQPQAKARKYKLKHKQAAAAAAAANDQHHQPHHPYHPSENHTIWVGQQIQAMEIL